MSNNNSTRSTSKIQQEEKIQDWLKSIPNNFPEVMDYYSGNTTYQNPLIGSAREDTYKNIRQVTALFLQIALPSHSDPVSMSLSEEATWGYINILECMIGAMRFEEKHRSDGGFTSDLDSQ